MPLSYSALYFPFIHFRNEAWLMLTALYWDKIYRIVPSEDTPRDSDFVRALKDEGFVNDKVPHEERKSVGWRFAAFLEKNADELRVGYGIREQAYWRKPEVWSETHADNDKMAFIYTPKMSPRLASLLVESDLAVTAPGERIGVYPDLASVYMASLANEIASNGTALYPLTDTPVLHLGTNCTLSRLGQALLKDVKMADGKPSIDELEKEMASCAIQAVIPRDFKKISIKQIVAIRKDYSDERAAFQVSIRELVTKLDWLQQITNAGERERHLKDQYKKHIAPKLTDLKKALRSNQIATTLSAMAIR